MKSFLTTTLSSALLLTLGSAAKVSYDGAKAMRIAVGEDVVPVAQLIADLKLQTWKGAPQGIPKPNTFVDLVVPADKVAAFHEKTASMTIETMHEDLGAAIDAEGGMSAYAGTKY